MHFAGSRCAASAGLGVDGLGQRREEQRTWAQETEGETGDDSHTALEENDAAAAMASGLQRASC